jgi:TonB family protein
VANETRAFVAALALHAVAAALLSLVQVPPSTAARSPGALEVEWRTVPIPASREPLATPRAPNATPHPLTATPRPSNATRPLVASSTPTPRPGAEPAAPITAAHSASASAATPEPPPSAPATDATAPAHNPEPKGPAQLFPRALLQDLADKSATAPSGARASPPATANDRDNPGGWLDDASAEARTRAGQVAPAWRDVERALVRRFKPPIDIVHDIPRRGIDRFADRMRTFAQQAIGVVGRGEEGLRHPIERGANDLSFGAGGYIDPGNEGFEGLSERTNIRSMPLAQQQAVAAATAMPAHWLTVEIELVVDGAGNVTSARVVMPSGRRAFDRYALRMVQEELARTPLPSSQSRWVCRAGYAVSRPDAIGIDVFKLFSRKTIRDSLQYPLKDRVDASLSLKWVKEAK